MSEEFGPGKLLNTDFIVSLSNNDIEVYKANQLFSEELEFQKDTLRCLIDKGISFCALVSGFRGTGKSVFVDYAMKECAENKDVIVVRFNSMKYDSYQSFLRQSIRELYLSIKDKPIKKNNKTYDKTELQKLYLSTFYDVKEMSDMVKNNSKSLSDTLENSLSINRDVSVNEILLLILATAVSKGFWGKIITFGLAILGKVGLSYCANRSLKSELSESVDNSYSFKCESVYDDEISTYYFEEELRKLKKAGKNIILVIDELDKLENTEVADILRDLKPLLLSDFCNAVLVGGINFEEELYRGKAGMNSVGTGIFNRRFYMPLASMKDLVSIGRKMMDDELDEEDDKVYLDFFKIKAIESRGVKRSFVNSIISSARGVDKLFYVEGEIENYVIEHRDLLGYYDTIEVFEDIMAQTYTDADYLISDVSIQYAQYLIQYIIAGGFINTTYRVIREKLDESICEVDREFIRGILSDSKKEDIIKYILDLSYGEDSSGDDGNNPDGPTPNGPVPDGPFPGGDSAANYEEDDFDLDENYGIEDLSNHAVAEEINPEVIRKIVREGRRKLDKSATSDNYLNANWGSGKSLNYVSMIRNKIANDEEWSDDFLNMVDAWSDRGIAIDKDEISNLNEIYRLVFFFSKYFKMSMEEFCEMCYDYLYFEKKVYYFEEQNPVDRLFLEINKDGKRKLFMSEYAELLMKIWYNMAINSGTYSNYDMKRRDNPYGPLRGIDFIDWEKKNGFEVKYYKSINYLNRYRKSILEQLTSTLTSNDAYRNLKNVAVIVFELNADMLQDLVLETKEVIGIQTKMIAVNLYSYETFKKSIDYIYDYFAFND
ncbi:KAP family P-loop domain-containing protein [Pseudobutyrivibrio sp. YE44]|uniref:P-loop NTPase fold protein n=1 Tax=Pseudobutyrivibrio sp. YE44 TaxID=1520802 RepID=UPI000883D246|nr:P-loop NTPase fold protein [Pseudobutyrivibrio sp. YE44]SDB56224.1 KAP family P-loop domain-containing protein [Pseudobutyrivibrio sp. YE44]